VPRSDDFGPTLELLNEHDAAFVQIDEPKFKTSIRQNQLPNITSFYYLRAHGRHWKKWWQHEHKDERYDYLYKPAEIQEFGETLKAVKKIVRKAYGYMNNHADAKSVANAIELKHFLGERVPEDLQPEMLKRYPALKVTVPVKAKQNALTRVRKGNYRNCCQRFDESVTCSTCEGSAASRCDLIDSTKWRRTASASTIHSKSRHRADRRAGQAL
jgi:Protein of unknown function DUF72